VTETAVIQVKQGIGDVVWHLPFIRAIAAASPGGTVTFLTLPSSHGRELLAAEPCIAATHYFEHHGSELRRGLNLIRLVTLLRRCRLRSLWILDRTLRPAVAGALAGIPERIGLGLGPQRFFITNAGIDDERRHDHPIEWLRALMQAMQIPLLTTEPALPLPAEVTATIGRRFAAHPRPWVVLGIGASQAYRDWPRAHWAAFIAGLHRRAAGTVFIVGGATQRASAQALIADTAGGRTVDACDLAVVEATALMHLADAFVGTDSGPMNLAAAAGVPAFALFGASPVLSYSRFIHPVLPDDGAGPSPDGMARISPASVLAQIEPYLAARRTAT
jgi:heptosyltransferase-2